MTDQRPTSMTNERNALIYRAWAPVYDLVMRPVYGAARRRAIDCLALQPGERVFISGVGTGLDLPLLPAGVRTTAADLNPAMLAKAQAKVNGRDVALAVMDAQALQLCDASFDAVILNLILSVVPDGAAAFREAWRVLCPGGRAVIFDKFLPEQARLSPLRVAAGWVIRAIGTDPNRRLSDLIGGVPGVQVERNEASLLQGQYRIVLLRKPGALKFQGVVVIVTGASAGIGRALALRLADQGAWIALAARDAQRLGALAEECGRRGGRAIAVPTDVTDEPQCKALVECAVAEYGRLDMLINNAGIGATGLLEELPDLTWFKRVMDVNFYGTVYCTYYAVKHLKETRGRIVNVSSMGGKAAVPYNTNYIASKFAVHGFSDSLRMELAGAGVSVTVACPWWVVTEFHERLVDKDGQPRGPRGRAIYGEKTMSADQCAQIILKSAQQRKREVLMGPGWLAVWLKLIAPGLLDKLTVEMFLKPAVRRAQREGDTK